MSTRGIALFLNLIALLLILNGCTTVGPDYKAPEMQSPEKWQKIEDNLLALRALKGGHHDQS